MQKWFKKKGYSHFDLPWEFDRALSYAQDVEKVKRHAFYPFISFDIEMRSRNEMKLRNVKYSSHVDGYIFAFYASQLTERYEKWLDDYNLSSVVLQMQA